MPIELAPYPCPLPPPLYPHVHSRTDNFCALSISKHLSAVHRTIIDACRIVGVWSLNVTIYYAQSGSQYGESWQGVWSVVQVAAA